MELPPLLGGWRRSTAPPATPASGAASPAAGATPSAPGFVYPSADPGLTAQAPDAILAANGELLAQLKLAYGCDGATFERDVLSLVRSYAAFVNVLPATPDNYFNDAGGLFRMGLEVGFFALQGTDGKIFGGRSTISGRRILEPRWRRATLIAGLCSEVHRVLSHIVVSDGGGAKWPAYMVPLTEWLARRNADRCFVRWVSQPRESRAGGLFALPYIVDASVLQYLSHENMVVVPHMLAAVGGIPGLRDHNIVDELVRRAVAVVINRNLQASADRYGKPQLGAHLERYLVDALRRLAGSDQGWMLNAPSSRLWLAQDGMFILWPQAVADVARLLDSEGWPGIPKVPETILEILLDAGVVEPRSDTLSTWLVCLPEAAQPQEAIKLAHPALLLSSTEPHPAPLGRSIVVATGGAAAAAGQGRSKPAGRKPVPAEQQAQRTIPFLHAVPGPANVVEPGPEAGDECEAALPPSTISVMAADDGGRVVLMAPLGLVAAVAQPLAQLIETLNGPGQPQCRVVAHGVFIPMTSLEQRHCDPGQVQRALHDAGMLVVGSTAGGAVWQVEFGGVEQAGLVLAPAWVDGLPHGGPANPRLTPEA
ncbi:MobH family relaxase [Rugamonas aquatica]|uniref:Relaxase n=1 Tax=Rugamonas aquatica TaxID=2743357 RepID=A0A6A7N6G4_9BURK|nr:MobH family relaxase [Rugamonas aquatica]MQA40626.1 relaxase [Rugamonas aquatica]